MGTVRDLTIKNLTVREPNIRVNIPGSTLPLISLYSASEVFEEESLNNLTASSGW